MYTTFKTSTPATTILTSTTTKSTQTTTPTSTTTVSSSSSSIGVACAGHYWPIGNSTVTDMITGKNATSLGSPLFVKDRFGVAGGAFQVSNASNAWRLPNDTYFTGDFTMTMWLNKISCSSNSSKPGTYCNFLNTNIIGI
jgi:hypothetical protein